MLACGGERGSVKTEELLSSVIEKETERGGELVFFISFIKHYPPPPCAKVFFLGNVWFIGFTKENNSGLNLLIPLFCAALCRYLGRETESRQ